MTLRNLDSELNEHPFVNGMPSEHVRTIASCAALAQFEIGKFIFREGENADRLYIISEGLVSLEASTPARGALVIQTLDGGEVLGWSWLFPPYRWVFDARAVAPTRAIALDAKFLRAKSEEDHDFGFELMKRIAHVMQERLQATRVQLLMGLYDVGT